MFARKISISKERYSTMDHFILHLANQIKRTLSNKNYIGCNAKRNTKTTSMNSKQKET